MAINKDEILELEKSFWEQANNPDLFKKSFADDGLAIMEPMGYLNKKQAMEISAKAKSFSNVQMKDVHVKELTPDCVALAYHGEGTPEGSDEPYRGSICSVYVKKNGNWQLAISDHQKWNPDEAHTKSDK